jgi:hypothetical protein
MELRGFLEDRGRPTCCGVASNFMLTLVRGPNGVAIAVVQEMLGHSDIRVMRGYTHVTSKLNPGRGPADGQDPLRLKCDHKCNRGGRKTDPRGEKNQVKAEPPIGIEPMTYALRVRRSGRLS